MGVRVASFSNSNSFTEIFPGKLRFYPILNISLTSLTQNQELSTVEKQQQLFYNQITSLLNTWAKTNIYYYQLRIKTANSKQYLQVANILATKQPKLKIIANDFWLEALEHPQIFYGLHLGQEDFKHLSPKQKVRLSEHSNQNKHFVLGLSTHNGKQIEQALIQDRHINWTYLALGPCFTTPSKNKQDSNQISLGLTKQSFSQALRSFVKQSSHTSRQPLPLVLIGGICSQNIIELLERIEATDISKEKQVLTIVIAAIQAAKNKQEILQICQTLTKTKYIG